MVLVKNYIYPPEKIKINRIFKNQQNILHIKRKQLIIGIYNQNAAKLNLNE